MSHFFRVLADMVFPHLSDKVVDIQKMQELWQNDSNPNIGSAMILLLAPLTLIIFATIDDPFIEIKE